MNSALICENIVSVCATYFKSVSRRANVDVLNMVSLSAPTNRPRLLVFIEEDTFGGESKAT